jgi:hypothetical protein
MIKRPVQQVLDDIDRELSDEIGSLSGDIASCISPATYEFRFSDYFRAVWRWSYPRQANLNGYARFALGLFRFVINYFWLRLLFGQSSI